MKNFQNSLPGEFYDTIRGKVKTMADGKKGVKAGKKFVLDPEVIYARALVLRHIYPDLDFEKLLVYELSLYPTSMFNKKRVMRPCNQKLKVMTGLKVRVLARTVYKSDAFFLDGCATFWVVVWPSYATSIFIEKGAMRPCNQKLKLMIGLKVEVSARNVCKPEPFFLDGCATFWVVV